MSTIVSDVRYAVRILLKKPGFTTIAVLTLALGIGLNTAVFSAIEALLLRPLPGVRDADRLVQVYRTYPGGFNYGSNSVPHYLDVRERSGDVFSGVAAWDYTPISFSSGGQTQRVMGQVVSANFFSVLGVSALRGRTFVSAEDASPGAHPVAIVEPCRLARIVRRRSANRRSDGRRSTACDTPSSVSHPPTSRGRSPSRHRRSGCRSCSSGSSCPMDSAASRTVGRASCV